MKIYNPAEIPFINKQDGLSPDKRILCIRAAEADSYTVISETDALFLTGSVTVRTLHTGTLTVELLDQDGNPLKFENVRDGDRLTAPDGTEFDLLHSFPL